MATSDGTASRGTSDNARAADVPVARARFATLLATDIERARELIAGQVQALGDTDAAGGDAGNDFYERLTCVAFSKERELLEATFEQRRPTGFTTGVCGGGSQEYVRFYVDHGSGWVDAGLVARTVYNLDESEDCRRNRIHPVSHAVTLGYEPDQRFCITEQIFRIRAILSWQVEPPAGDPDWPPFWGDVEECAAQVQKATLKPFPKLPIAIDKLDEIIGFKSEAALAPPLALPALAELYGDKRVEPRRFAFTQLSSVVKTPPTTLAAAQAISDTFKKLDFDLGKLLAEIDDTAGNVDFEELECVALDDGPGQLVASFRIKRSSGYSGGLCTAGSTEYVAFWIDLDDDCTWEHVGTVEVSAHDLDSIPDDGLCYSAILPIDLSTYRRDCDEPVVGRVRAVLSWNAPPSTTDPDDVPTWGNRVDAHVQVRPGIPFDPTLGIPAIALLGGIAVHQIGASGLTTPDAVFAFNGFKADVHDRLCPFGGRVVVTGPPIPGYEYRVMVRPAGGSWVPVTSAFLTVDQNGNPPVTVNPGVDGWTAYAAYQTNILSTLGFWNTDDNQLWHVRLEARPTPLGPVTVSTVHHIQVDSTPPDAAISITSGTGDCGRFDVGDTIAGIFTATDDRFGSWSLSVAGHASANTPSALPLLATDQALNAPWSLSTTGMVPCGYTVQVQAWDRTIMNSVTRGRSNQANIGFCLE